MTQSESRVQACDDEPLGWPPFDLLRLLFGRQFERKRRSILSARGRPQTTVMGFDYGAANRQAHPRPLRLCGEECME